MTSGDFQAAGETQTGKQNTFKNEKKAPSSLQLHLGQSSPYLHLGTTLLWLRLVPPSLWLRWAPPSLPPAPPWPSGSPPAPRAPESAPPWPSGSTRHPGLSALHLLLGLLSHLLRHVSPSSTMALPSIGF